MPVKKDEIEAVRSANERFYRAFETLDMPAMVGLWSHGDHVKCVHPGWGLLVGWDAVRASWDIIFRNTGEIRFTLTDVQVECHGALAWVTLTENILTQVEGHVAATAVLATNVFEKMPGGWRIVHHHASHVLMPPARHGTDTVH